MIKQEVSKEFSRLRSFGFLVVNFNDSRPLRKQQKSFVDFFITNGKYLVFVEIKIGRDVLSEGQKETGRYLSSASIHNKNTFYKLLTNMRQVRKLTDDLLSGKL